MLTKEEKLVIYNALQSYRNDVQNMMEMLPLDTDEASEYAARHISRKIDFIESVMKKVASNGATAVYVVHDYTKGRHGDEAVIRGVFTTLKAAKREQQILDASTIAQLELKD